MPTNVSSGSLRWSRVVFSAAVAIAVAQPLIAATFVVPGDRDLIRRSDTIVIGDALSSYSRENEDGGIETVTSLSVERVIKGTDVPSIVNVVEPGGEIGGRMTIIAGSPRFEAGKRMLLLLSRTGTDRWAVSELVLGKFSFETDRGGQKLLVRDESEITGWDPDLSVHRELRRSADRFLRFVETEARGGMGTVDYVVRPLPLTGSDTSTSALPPPTTLIAPYTATSYTMTTSGTLGSRWTTFPNPVTFFRGTTAEPGAPNGGDTAITTAFASWDNDCGSNVNYVYGGVDNGTHTQGLHATDGANTILFERDLSAWGVSKFSCSSTGYSGTLGLGGITSASGSNTVNGEAFVTTVEADVEMNQGLANCTLLFSNGDFNSAVTHEVGHTLGFRHSDQDRASSGSCTSDPTLECSNQAIMKSFVSQGLNGALQPYDQHAVQAVYPGNVCAPSGGGGTCTAPAISTITGTQTITAGSPATLSVSATGSTPLSYQWYTGTSGSGTPISGATGPTLSVSPTSTTSYWVKVSNACGSANSSTVTVTVSAITATKLYLVTPCRLIDSRSGSPVPSGGVRNVAVGGMCGIPTGPVAGSFNVTVVSPGSGGYATVYPGPAGASASGTSTINFSTKTLANNAVIRIGPDGTINFLNGSGAAIHFIIDVNGYFK